MEILQNFKKIDPKRAGYLQFALRFMVVLQIIGYVIMLSAVFGGWSLTMPGEDGFYRSIANRIVNPSEKKVVEKSSFLTKIGQASEEIGTIIVEFTLRLAAISLGLMIILFSGWIRRRIRNWLISLKIKTTEEKIEILEKRIVELEKKQFESKFNSS